MSGTDGTFEAGPTPRGYGEAIAELEQILAEIEHDDVDVDRLAERVRRAAELLTFCRTRITDTRFEIERVVADLEPVVPEAPRAGDADPWETPPT
ncbi:MAG: exodeoxyribonuclease VII small subunit [Acidimicrobiia bacterium]|nr:exodeoxyribonuclease VII small subunit [Acidimicrobiia bacterium]